MKTAIMYGAGNIGRGFIGTLFSASGYRTVFVDVSIPVIDALNRDGQYPIRILSGDTKEDIDVKNVCAVDGNRPGDVVRAIADADVMATAVGVNVLPLIIPNLVAGLRLRKERGCKPFNILICENLMNAGQILNRMIKAELTDDEATWFDENIGLVETSIGRMVPIQTEEMKDGNPLRVCVERYDRLPVDRAAFKGEIPVIKNMIPFEPFEFYVKRKLYIHNLGHAVCAYLGGLLGLEYISQSIARHDIYAIVSDAMGESARALSLQYDVEISELSEHIDDLLDRFSNTALKDTCQRVGGDPKRKLSPEDRLIGAATCAMKNGIRPVGIIIGIAAAMHRYIAEVEKMPQSPETAERVLRDICGLKAENPLTGWTLNAYSLLCDTKNLGIVRRAAALHICRGDVSPSSGRKKRTIHK